MTDDVDPAIPRTALVTGGAKRIGRAVCDGLAADGWRVALHYHGSSEEADEACAEIAAASGRTVVPVRADLADPAETRALIGAAVAAVGPLGLLVNSAAIFEGPDWRETTEGEIDRHMAINFRAPLVLMQEFARALPKDAGGTVVNIIDQRVWNLTPYFPAYTASKTALWTATRQMALALAPRIRVNAVGPGPTLQGPRQSPADFEAQWRGVPLARRTRASEIAEAVLFLARARAVTGQMLALDGGEHLGWRQDSDGTAPVE
ncbi:SDR family oxidoreductase [Marivibrio halodurans]|uniref:SDR family oxidoreductase n=1 Tax=Marivibrio halodurans TaxID=2039722 RepID=A0A8J7V210_9PROT|nr:SDR family oxidoreductase [Marivibrio halodurans]MBP5856661.1 SDR family oxidoreductase [Marivibrio halodurans]